MKIMQLKYGNTNTWLVGGLLVDTDMAGTMPALMREMKRQGCALSDIRYIFATHFHPDHAGLVGELMRGGVKLLLLDKQVPFLHFSDRIYAREGNTRYIPIDEREATVIKAEESRAFLAGLGIDGEIVPTESHSPDGAALILDDGNAFIGDVEPFGYLEGYPENDALARDMERILGLGTRVIHRGHIPDETRDSL